MVTKRHKDGAARIQSALERGLRVIAMAGNWFEVGSFREVVNPEGYKIWYATTSKPGGRWSGHPGKCVEHPVTSVAWEER
jgi:hypothetical protein